MFDGNWLLYIFIIMLLFANDGEIKGTELAVLIATVFAVLTTDGECGMKNCCPNNNQKAQL